MSRFGAFAAHLAISLAIFAMLAALVLFAWYPDFLFAADGGWEGLRIILLVDLVAGPLLTLIVYQPGKPGLRMDLTLIAVFQASRPLRTLVHYYQPLAPELLDMEREAITTAELEARDAEARHLPAWLARHGGSIADYAFFRFATRYQYAFLGVRRADGELVGLLRTQGQP